MAALTSSMGARPSLRITVPNVLRWSLGTQSRPRPAASNRSWEAGSDLPGLATLEGVQALAGRVGQQEDQLSLWRLWPVLP